MTTPLIGMPQGAEWIVILVIVILVFGAAKLPELARGTGQALRIFKAETKGLSEDDDKDETSASSSTPTSTMTPEQREIEARRVESERVAPEQGHRDDTTA